MLCFFSCVECMLDTVAGRSTSPPSLRLSDLLHQAFWAGKCWHLMLCTEQDPRYGIMKKRPEPYQTTVQCLPHFAALAMLGHHHVHRRRNEHSKTSMKSKQWSGSQFVGRGGATGSWEAVCARTLPCRNTRRDALDVLPVCYLSCAFGGVPKQDAMPSDFQISRLARKSSGPCKAVHIRTPQFGSIVEPHKTAARNCGILNAWLIWSCCYGSILFRS